MTMRAPDKRYTDEQIKLALTVLAATGGRPRKAAKILERENDLTIPADVLRYWKHRDPKWSEQYARILQDTGPRIQRLLAEHHQALATEAAEVEAEAIQKTAERLDDPDLDAKDMSNIAKNLATAAGIHTDKHNLLTGQPTAITGHLNLNEIASSLASLGVQVEIDGEAVEIEDDEPPPKPPRSLEPSDPGT